MLDLGHYAALDHDGGDVLVTFPDVPEVITSGQSVGDALYQASDALGLALLGYVGNGLSLPQVTAETPHRVTPLVDYALQIEVIELFRSTGISVEEFALRLAVRPRKIEDLLDWQKHSSVRFMERALHALGCRPHLCNTTNVSGADTSA